MTALRSGKRSGPPLAAPAACDVRNYDFLRYVNKQRMVTFWYQLAEIMRGVNPSDWTVQGVAISTL